MLSVMANPLPVVQPLDAWLESCIISTSRMTCPLWSFTIWPPQCTTGTCIPLHEYLWSSHKLSSGLTMKPAQEDRQQGVWCISTDLMGARVPSRTAIAGCKREVVLKPDFIIVKQGQNMEMTHHWLSLKLEQRGWKPLEVDIDQIRKYMASVFSKTPTHDLKGYLVEKGTTYVYSLPAAAISQHSCCWWWHGMQLKASCTHKWSPSQPDIPSNHEWVSCWNTAMYLRIWSISTSRGFPSLCS